MSVRTKLTMHCDITPVSGQDQFGDEVLGTLIPSVPCFVFGNKPRLRNELMQETGRSFQILFNPDVDVDINYRISNILNHKEVTVFDSGVVVRIEKNFHPKKSLVLIQAFVEKR